MNTIIGILILVLGATIASFIDQLLGISFKEVGNLASFIHKVIYMAWGAITFHIGMTIFTRKT